jgi:hypothetical protein
MKENFKILKSKMMMKEIRLLITELDLLKLTALLKILKLKSNKPEIQELPLLPAFLTAKMLLEETSQKFNKSEQKSMI